MEPLTKGFNIEKCMVLLADTVTKTLNNMGLYGEGWKWGTLYSQ